MKILLTGSAGYVGEIIKSYFDNIYEIICLDLVAKNGHQLQCDLRDKFSLEKIAHTIIPDLVIHAVGNKNIGFCENNSVEAYRINCDTVKNIAQVFGGKARIIYISTDYVFDGLRGEYAEDDDPNPSTIYGKSKLCGEIHGARICNGSFIILRLSALYDGKAAFVRYLHDKLKLKETVQCFSNVFYSPTYVGDFLRILSKIIGYFGDTQIFHACGEITSRYEFALAFAKTFGFDQRLVEKQTYTRQDDLFLFPDLSMTNKATCRLFRIQMTKIEEALLMIKQEEAQNEIIKGL